MCYAVAGKLVFTNAHRSEINLRQAGVTRGFRRENLRSFRREPRAGEGFLSAKVVKVDAANDLALLKAEGRFAPLPIAASRAVKLGGTVATVGFPNIGLQGFAPKLATPNG